MSDHKCLAFMIKHSLNTGEGELFASHCFEVQHDQQDLAAHEIRVEFTDKKTWHVSVNNAFIK